MTLLVPFDPERELAELRAYLGDDFDERKLEGHTQLMEDELAAAPTEEELYRTSQGYLYDLTVFAMSGTKRPYLQLLADELPPGAKLLDYGCGIGADGLALLEAGYDVAFADFDNPSTAYLKWRLEHRGLSARVYDLDAGDLPGGFDLAYSFDVIEHVPDPFAFLHEMESRADRVLVNFLAPDPFDIDLHHNLPIRRLVAHAARHDLRRYEVLHERSHVVLYGTGSPTPRGVVRGVAARIKTLRA